LSSAEGRNDMACPTQGKPVIVVTAADLAQQAVELLHDFDVVYAGKAPDENNLVQLCERTQPVAIIVRYGKISARVLDASHKLRVVSKHGVGIDSIDADAMAKRGIALKAASGANAAAVAEHTWALIFACAKSIVQLDARMQAGYWDKATHKGLELKGKMLGLIGIGAIGKRVSEVAMTLGMRVLAYDPYASSAPTGVTMCALAAVLTEADVVTLHCPLTAETRHLINRQTLALMRNGAILINTARGALVEQQALLDAIHEGKLRSVGLDTFETEPLTGPHAFSSIPNVILTPHVAGVTSDTYVSMGITAARNVLDVLAEAQPATAR
jgi:D-3-phosphoglycerate dehydrogenase